MLDMIVEDALNAGVTTLIFTARRRSSRGRQRPTSRPVWRLTEAIQRKRRSGEIRSRGATASTRKSAPTHERTVYRSR